MAPVEHLWIQLLHMAKADRNLVRFSSNYGFSLVLEADDHPDQLLPVVRSEQSRHVDQLQDIHPLEDYPFRVYEGF